ncbi:MAG: DUF4330 domain-containing protein [Clostridia bacterium]|nr:DUF4330 domain-containing protein [Clostridia bacterium]
MIIDKEGRLFGKINIIDAVIILVIILSASILGVRFLGGKSRETQYITKNYIAKVASIKPSSAEYIKEGDLFYDDEGSFMGKVVQVNLTPAKEIETKADGQYVLLENPSRVDVYITIEGEGCYNNQDFYLDGKVSLLVGADRFLCSDKIEMDSTIYKILD